MWRRLLLAAVAVGAVSARAEISLSRVPVVCGTIGEVQDFLKPKMPAPQPIGKAIGKTGEDIAVLFAGNNYWALVAAMSANEVCVVASGYNWTSVNGNLPESY